MLETNTLRAEDDLNMSHYKQGFPPERDGETGLRGLKLLLKWSRKPPIPPEGAQTPGFQWKSICSIRHWGLVVQIPAESQLTLTYRHFCVNVHLIVVLKGRDGFVMKALAPTLLWGQQSTQMFDQGHITGGQAV